jgi:hypothetical protein
MAGLSIGISQTLVTPPRRVTGPDAPLLGERMISLVAAAGAPALGLVAARTAGPIGLVVALVYAAVVGLTVASAPVAQVRLVPAVSGWLAALAHDHPPAQGYQCGLLRVSGLEYQFRPVKFQHRLAAQSPRNQ